MTRHSRTAAAIVLTVGKGFAAIAYLGSMAILARILSREEYAAFRQAMVLLAVLSPLLTFGFPQSLLFFVPQFPAHHRTLIRRALIGSTTGAILAAVGFGVLAAPLARALSNSEQQLVFAAFAIYFAASVPFSLADSVYASTGRPGSAAGGSAAARLILLAGLVVPVHFFDLSLPASLIVLGVLQWGLTLALYATGPRGSSGNTVQAIAARPPSTLTQLLHTSPLALASILAALGAGLDKLVVAAITTPSEFAIYANGAVDNPLVYVLSSSAALAIAPDLVRARAHDRLPEFLSLWKRSISRVLCLTLPIIASLMLLAPNVVIFLFSEEYSESAPVFRIYTLISILRLVSFSTLFMALSMNKSFLILQSISMLLVAPLTYSMTRVFGLEGAAAAVLITNYLMVFFMLLHVRRTVRVGWTDILPFGAILTAVVLTLPSILAANQLLVYLRFANDISTILVGTATALAVYVTIGFGLMFLGFSNPVSSAFSSLTAGLRRRQ